MVGKCLACGEEAMDDQRGVFRFDPPANVPGGTMIIEGAEWRECTRCGERVIPHALHKRLEDEARRRQGLLTPAEIKAVREKTGLTQEQMAHLLGVGDKTYTRWESGRSFHNKSSDNLIRLVDQSPEVFLQFDAQRQPDRLQLITEYVRNLPSFKGENKFAMAAHGVELDPTIGDLLRRRLREIVEGRRGS